MNTRFSTYAHTLQKLRIRLALIPISEQEMLHQGFLALKAKPRNEINNKNKWNLENLRVTTCNIAQIPGVFHHSDVI
jgi:hypothetical protein